MFKNGGKKQLPAYGIIILRFIQAPFVIRAPVLMVIASVLLDIIDGLIFATAGFNIKKYQYWDKWADLFWYSFVLIYVFYSYPNKLLLVIFSLLYVLRLVGHTLFFLTRNRRFFFYCPNVFEAFFWFYLLALKTNPELLKLPTVIYALIIAAGLKLIQEYHIHVRELIFIRKALLFIGPALLPWQGKD